MYPCVSKCARPHNLLKNDDVNATREARPLARSSARKGEERNEAADAEKK